MLISYPQIIVDWHDYFTHNIYEQFEVFFFLLYICIRLLLDKKVAASRHFYFLRKKYESGINQREMGLDQGAYPH